MLDKITQLRHMLDDSRYTVALCGSGMLEEGGLEALKKQERAYEIEEKYGCCVEEMFTSAFYNTRPEQFFEFYKNEILRNIPRKTATAGALADMERAGKLQCIIDTNTYEQMEQAGCRNVINLHGSIYKNQCPRCKRMYPISYMLEAKRVPLCEECNIPIRPLICLSGEMVDSQNMTRTTQEISQADVLLLLGTTLGSEVFKQYVKYFSGRYVVVIHKQEHYTDKEADLLIMDYPMNVLPQLHYGNETGENA